MMARRTIMAGIASVAVAMSSGCGTTGGRKKIDESRLEEIPPVPEGFVPLPSEATAFRAATIHTPIGAWRINFDDGITKIETVPYVVTKLDPKWYPREGGAYAARCTGYQRGLETLVRLEGSSETVIEETRILFENGQLREVVKYSLPGTGVDLANPPEAVPYAQRVKRGRY
jgi:hypothetical protein